MSFENNIKLWVENDNKIKLLLQEIKLLRNEKNNYNNNIMNYIHDNNLENATIKIGNGKLNFIDSNQQQPLTYKFIIEGLYIYFNNDEDKVLDIINFLKSRRIIKSTKEIKRTYS